MKDVIVIGMGPAGVSASLYLKRSNIDVFIIAKDFGALEKAHRVDNYYGISASGIEIAKAGVQQAENLGIEIIKEDVIGIEYSTDASFFVVKTNHNKYDTKTILLATGKSRKKINVENFDNLDGKGISYCALCDGFFYRNKKLGIIGSSHYMKEELEHLSNFTSDIIVFTNNEELEVEVNQQVIEGKINKVIGTDKIEGIIVDDVEYQLDGLFVAIGTPNAMDFAKHIGIVTNNNDIVVNEFYETNIKNIFAAGDAIGGTLQINKTVTDGMYAAKGILNALKK